MYKLIKTLPAILKASEASEEVAEAACIAGWRHAVGEGLNSHAVPIQLQGQKLVVVVADNIWKNQLEQMCGQLLFRLNSVLGQPLVKSIDLRVDPKTLASIRGREARERTAPALPITRFLLNYCPPRPGSKMLNCGAHFSAPPRAA